MKLLADFLQRLRWVNLPGAVLIALLQRTPVVRLVTLVDEAVAASPIGAVMRSALAIAASLGAVDTLAGATTNITLPIGTPNPISAKVGVPIPRVMFFVTSVGGTRTPGSWEVKEAFPPGLVFGSGEAILRAVGTVNVSTPFLEGTPAQAGNYVMKLRAWMGLGGDQNGDVDATNVFTFTVNVAEADPVPPSFSQHPMNQSVNVGANVTFTAMASGSPPLNFQWRRNGANIPGASSSSLTLSSVQMGDAGDYSVEISNRFGSATSNPALLTVTSVDRTARLTNLSVRTAMGPDQRLIVGVVVHDGTRDILVRAAGPALATFGLLTAMTDPRLELYNGAEMVLSNNDWSPLLAPVFASVGAFGFTAGSKDAAFVRDLNAAYSIQAVGTGPGVVLVEAYDTGEATAARLVNVSARNRVGTGDDIMIAGFTISGPSSKQLLIRAVGPKLNAFGVPETLVNPKLEIFDSAGVKVTENDDWSISLAPTFLAVGAFQLDSGSRDAALVATLPAGSYTAQVRGSDGGTGEALIEIYEVP